MVNIIKRHKRFGKYIIVSAITTLVNILSYLIFLEILNDMYILSNIFSWIISIFITFILNKRVVFKKKSERKREIIRELVLFYLVRLTSLAIDTGVLCICIELLKFNDILAKIISNVSTTFNNYFISKHFVFK